MAKPAAKKTAAPAKIGRPTRFTPELAERVCNFIAQGDIIAEVEKREGMPGKSSIFRWLATEGESYQAFRESYARACKLRTAPRVERLREIGEMAAAGKVDAAGARVLADIEKWCLAREEPKKYGDAYTVKGDKENPLQVQQSPRDLTDEELAALAAGGLREAF